LAAIFDLAGDGGFAGEIEQSVFVPRHDELWHEILEHDPLHEMSVGRPFAVVKRRPKANQ
jgi:hypothetical protein